MIGSEISGEQLGIIGLGRIGQAVAEKAPPLRHDASPITIRRRERWPGFESMTLDQLLATSDVISLHVPLSPQTRHLIDRTALSRMKRSAYLINTSRGLVVDEDGAGVGACAKAIIKGAGLDVYEDEPKIHPGLLALENVVLVPHMASATAETRAAMYDLVARNVVERPVRPAARHADPVTGVGCNFTKNVSHTRPDYVGAVMRTLAVAITGLELPAVEKISESRAEDPFQVTIATLLSARTQDATTYAASERLFRKAATPQAMAKLTVKQIEKLIYPVSFYRYKARYIKATCAKILKEFGGRTPTTMEELLTLPGVGRKTANLVLILAYRSQQNICVDTHVHRIANRLGWVGRRHLTRRSRRCIA